MAQWAWGLHGQVQLVPGQVGGLRCTARLSLASVYAVGVEPFLIEERMIDDVIRCSSVFSMI